MWFVFPFYLLVTSGYLDITCFYLVVTSGYLIATTGYFWLLLITSLLLVPYFSNNKSHWNKHPPSSNKHLPSKCHASKYDTY